MRPPYAVLICMSIGLRTLRVVDLMALLGPRGLADEGSPDPLDLEGARPARAVSRSPQLVLGL